MCSQSECYKSARAAPELTYRPLKRLIYLFGLPLTKQLGGMTHHVNGGRPGRQARSRPQGSIGVPPVFPIRVQDDDQKLAERTSPCSHSPRCSRHSETQARRLCYLGLGVMPLPKARRGVLPSRNVETPGSRLNFDRAIVR